MDIGTLDEYLCAVADTSCIVICCRGRVAESSTIHTMQEGIAIHGYLGVICYGTSIATTQYAEDGEVRNALRVIQDIHVLIRTPAAVRTGELLGIISHFSVVVAIFAFHVDGNIGASHDGVLTISAAEHREMRVLVVIIRFLPFWCFQKRIRGHTLLYIYRSSSCYGAGKVSSAIDVMRVDELVVNFVIELCLVNDVVFSFYIIPNVEILYSSIP